MAQVDAFPEKSASRTSLACRAGTPPAPLVKNMTETLHASRASGFLRRAMRAIGPAK